MRDGLKKKSASCVINKYISSFDLRKSEVEKGEKRAKSWCHNHLFLVSRLLVSNDIHQHGNFKEK